MRKKERKTGGREKPAGLRREQAADIIRWLILSGSPGFRSGNIITEDQLEGLGLTKSPSREALSQLEKEGLVTIQPRVGTQVRVVSNEEARALMTIRTAIETIVVGELAESQVDIAPLRAIHEEMKKIADLEPTPDGNTIFTFIKADMEFHSKMAELAVGYAAAAQSVRDLTSQFLLYASSNIRKAGAWEVMQEVLGEHEAIISAIGKGASESARDHLHRHIRKAVKRLAEPACRYMDESIPKYIAGKVFKVS